MTGRYVALLDVLGFSALVSGERGGERLQVYQDCLESVFPTKQTPDGVQFVVFSDTIVLTTNNLSEHSLQAIVTQSARVYGKLLEVKIPIRGAISQGNVLRTRRFEHSGVFVAGRAVVDAHQYEQRQDWIGIMVCPTVVAEAPWLGKRCEVAQYGRDDELEVWAARFPWPVVLSKWGSIPFKDGFGVTSYDGYAILPCSDPSSPEAADKALERSLRELHSLREAAPDPAAQAKYERTIKFVSKRHMLVHANAHSHAQMMAPRIRAAEARKAATRTN